MGRSLLGTGGISVTTGEINRRWTEGTVTFKKDGIYYIMYSANHFGGEHYAVGYATSSSPLGPFKKAENNPVLHKNTDKGGIVSGTGHNTSFILRMVRKCFAFIMEEPPLRARKEWYLLIG